ncbi:hypothetical protein [Schlegelella koreensis]|uniref:Uncharacterized protein n=1 Tax=Piscinibacter koreensis TaxID=2742824 RepID=A0A7Y6TY01_9BURK|nr:hypothetical protein [Schlegelella koreensis]
MGIIAFEWTGAVLGLLGAFLLATHTTMSRYDWLAFLGANAALIEFALAIGAHGLLVQQRGFTATTLLGIHRSRLYSADTQRLTAVAAQQGAAAIGTSETQRSGRRPLQAKPSRS